MSQYGAGIGANVLGTEAEKQTADKTGAEYLKNSPYKDKLATAALFLSALQERSGELPNLLRPHLGNSTAGDGKVKRAWPI